MHTRQGRSVKDLLLHIKRDNHLVIGHGYGIDRKISHLLDQGSCHQNKLEFFKVRHLGQ